METKIRYEFICDLKDGSKPVVWGYRSNKKAAIKRQAELNYFFHNHGHPKATVEVVKVVCTETRHPADLDKEQIDG